MSSLRDRQARACGQAWRLFVCSGQMHDEHRWIVYDLCSTMVEYSMLGKRVHLYTCTQRTGRRRAVPRSRAERMIAEIRAFKSNPTWRTQAEECLHPVLSA